MSIASWDDVDNTFALMTGDGLTHSTRDGEEGYVVGGDFATSEISQTCDLPDGWGVGAVALLTFQRGNIGDNTDDLGNVILEALDVGDSVLDDVETGDESFSPANIWHARRLTLAIPSGATKLRVRLVATRDGGTGTLAAAFDDFDLRTFKDLDPSYAIEYDFTEPTVQPTPRNWQRFHLAFRDLVIPDVMIAHGIHAISAPRPITGEGIVWSDATGQDALPFLGAFGIAEMDDDYVTSRVYREAFQFVYQGPHLQLFGNGTKRRGLFSSDESFTVRLVLKVREYGSGAGVVGVRDTTSGVGWGVEITSSGQARATLQGLSGTKTATSAASIADGAPHQIVMVYNASDDTVKIYVDRRGAVSTSTASGMGEFELPAGPATTYPLRVGTDRSSTDVFGGELLECELFNAVALSETEIEAMWTYGSIDEAIAVNLSQSVWAPCESTTEVPGVTLVRCATDQAPLGYAGAEYGLAMTGASDNLWPSNDTEDTGAFVAESTVTVTRSIADNTGLFAGIRVAGDATHGLVVTPVTLSSGACMVVLFARATSGTPSLSVALLNSSDSLIDSDSATLSTDWQRIVVSSLTFDGSTATGKLRLRSAGTFELAHVAFVAQEITQRIPTVFQDAGVSIQQVYASITATHPAQLNHEGEIDIAGRGVNALPPTGRGIAQVGHAGDNVNRRWLLVGASQVPRLLHYDSDETSVQALCTAIDWSEEWRLRARWCRVGIPSEAGNTFAGLLTTGSVDSDDLDARTAAWTVDDTECDETLIGAELSAPLDAYVRRFAVRSREPRL